MGYENGRPRMWRMKAFPSKSRADWEIFLRGLGGAPQRVVCDNDLGMTAAVRAAFPQADVYFCEWHLKYALDRLLKKLCADEPDHRADYELLRGRLDAAFTGLSFWRSFTAQRTPSAPGDSAIGSPRPERYSRRSSPAAAYRPNAPPTRR
jgi:hypothetical protein